MSGSGVFAEDGRPCRFDYEIVCDRDWNTEHVRVAGWNGAERVDIEIAADSTRRWYLNGSECAAVAGCMDIDLSFTPATNILPIRRLDLRNGVHAEVRAAWLRFPGLTLELLGQRYHRTASGAYRYEIPATGFVADLEVDERVSSPAIRGCGRERRALERGPYIT